MSEEIISSLFFYGQLYFFILFYIFIIIKHDGKNWRMFGICEKNYVHIYAMGALRLYMGALRLIIREGILY